MSLIEPVKPKEEKEEKINRKNQVQSFNEKYSSFLKRKATDNVNTQKSEVVNITNYRWASQEEDFEKWFISTGGVKKRIEILISLAEKLADYHRKIRCIKTWFPNI